MVPPVIHRVLTAAGIKDCSATIEGSRNPMQVLKATIQLLHSGVSSIHLRRWYRADHATVQPAWFR